VLGLLAFRLRELNLEGSWIDLREKIAGVDELSLGKRHANELSVHAGPNRHGVQGRHGSQTDEIDGEVAGPSCGGGDRGRRRGLGFRGGRRLLRLGLALEMEYE